MRFELFTIGSIVHVTKRGARGLDIFADKDKQERWRFLKLLYYLNDKNCPSDWASNISDTAMFTRPYYWPDRKPIVDVICFTLLDNHFHLLLKETEEGGISLFMKKIGDSMIMHFNKKHGERGSIFQGSYRGRTIGDDRQFRYVCSHIMVKNVFEKFPGGLKSARKDFNKAWDWSLRYPFFSLPDYFADRRFPIVNSGLFSNTWDQKPSFKKFSKDVIMGGRWEKDEDLGRLLMD